MSSSNFTVEALTDTLANLDLKPWALPGSLVVGGLGVCYLVFRQSGLPLPPGPTISWFGLGGKTSVKMPQAYAWLVFADWQKKFGDVIYINVFRNPLLVVNSAEAAFDLLEKKSSIYSSRPVRTMQAEVMGFSWLFSGLPYGPWYKKHRTMFHNHFQAKAIPKYHHTLVDSAHTLLRNLSRTPENLLHHLRRTTTAIVLSVCYGHHVAEQGDEYVKLADQAMAGVGLSANFGTFLVDYIPLLKYVPAWFPGAKFKRDGLKWRKLGLEMWNRPFDMANPDPDVETLIKDVSATAYAAGSDTTLSILLSFFLAMVIHPEIQERAFAEISAAIPDGDRLPSFEDRAKLPYLDCLVQECLRWNPVGNVALAHYLTEDDVYRGWRVPKGTTVLANIWAMLHEPSVRTPPFRTDWPTYPSLSVTPTPQPSIPTDSVMRSEPTASTRSPELAYGFGRRSGNLPSSVSPLTVPIRICPGRFLATDTIWIVAVSTIASYKILKPLDEAGNEVTPEVAYTPGLFSRPKPFGYRLVPRSEKVLALMAGNA
ncbi:O-methylsterigmatocystin oxidoreductase [Mycena venus]|uniref:O-methylsterigmatocystin oxidoreductase n=1 Tax=Mycena venus TaxID=2733690 RepID=A0A8H6Y954_9AGAR|nr:O-methylsterigmatocystin oxidoreductase [Mycena venus]